MLVSRGRMSHWRARPSFDGQFALLSQRRPITTPANHIYWDFTLLIIVNSWVWCGCTGALVVNNHEFQDAFCSTPDAVTAMVAMYQGCTSRALLSALTEAVCNVVRQNPTAQKMFVAAGVTEYISNLLALKVYRPVYITFHEAHSENETIL